jgi:tRNA-specific 2-thiouridylase
MDGRVVVAMSGGVDSGVAALLLSRQGYDVIGVSAALLGTDESTGECCSLAMAEEARRVCRKIGVPHFMMNLKEMFAESVIKDYLRAYQTGTTPNPCVTCNKLVKFDRIIKYAKAMDADLVATGHYANIEDADGALVLKKGVDPRKDQSYFLYILRQEVMPHLIFPLGGLTKDEVRTIAREAKLPNANKAESQDICFVRGEDPMKSLLAKHMNAAPSPGSICDPDGKVLGRHKGIEYYTLGQREGLGISAGERLYVYRIDPSTNTIYVAPQTHHPILSFRAGDINLVTPTLFNDGAKYSIKTRYHQKPMPATVRKVSGGDGESFDVTLDEPHYFITPGQSLVIYDGATVIGGGTIERGADIP